jgi:hypothetical protein
MIKLGILFMVVTIAAGVNHTIAAYNDMMGRPGASRALVIESGPAGQVEIGVLGQRLSVPDPVETAKARLPEWQLQAASWRGVAATWQTRITAWRVRADDLFNQAVTKIKQRQSGNTEQKNRL